LTLKPSDVCNVGVDKGHSIPIRCSAKSKANACSLSRKEGISIINILINPLQ
jgi:hypothetical protein